MPLSDFVNVQVSVEAALAAGNNFGIPLIRSYSASWVERVRSYSSLSAVESDFALGTPEQLQAKAIFSQEPHPPLVKIGRCANKPTLRWALTPVVTDGDTYKVTLVATVATVPTEYVATYVAGTMVDLPFTAQSANFTAGKTLTGGSSGAKAIILTNTDGGTTGTLRLVGVRGTFTNGETITDDNGTPGSATAGTPAAVTGVSATAAEIINGLRSKIDALGLAVTCSDQTTYLRVVANAAGAWFGLYVDDVAKLGVAMDHADPGVAADLTAIETEDSEWYGILDQFPSAAVISGIAGWAETREKVYATVSQDSAIVTHVLSGATDIAATLQTADYFRTIVFYKRKAHQFADGALFGVLLPKTPGSETWAFKTLATIDPDRLTDSQYQNAQNKNALTYTTLAKRNKTTKGKVASGEFADTVRFRDWQASDVRISVFDALATPDKLPMTDEGIAVIQNVVLGSLKRGVAAGGLKKNPAPKVTVPLAADIPDADRAIRNLPGVEGLAYLAGAIHSVDPLKITIIV